MGELIRSLKKREIKKDEGPKKRRKRFDRGEEIIEVFQRGGLSLLLGERKSKDSEDH